MDELSVSLINEIILKSNAGLYGDVSKFEPTIIIGKINNKIQELNDEKYNLQENEKERNRILMAEEYNLRHKLNHLTLRHHKLREESEKLFSSTVKISNGLTDFGSQLENLSTPKLRLVSSSKLIKLFFNFYSGLEFDFFNNNSSFNENCELICQLYKLSSQLATDQRFQEVHIHISEKYSICENMLSSMFNESMIKCDYEKMKENLSLLHPFTDAYNKSILRFIKTTQKNNLSKMVSLEDIKIMCTSIFPIIDKIAPVKSDFFTRFLDNLFIIYIKDFIASKLSLNIEKGLWLESLYSLYNNVLKLCNELVTINQNCNCSTMFMNINQLFSKSLTDYMQLELNYLQEFSSNTINLFYESIGHNKKTGIANFGKALFRSVGGDYAKSTLLISYYHFKPVVDEFIAVANRCFAFSELAGEFSSLFRIKEICHALIRTTREFIEYGIDDAKDAIPTGEVKSPYYFQFIDVLSVSMKILNLIDNTTEVNFNPKISSVERLKLIELKDEIVRNLINKMESGIDKSMSASISYIRYLLRNELRSINFSSEDLSDLSSGSQNKVATYVQDIVNLIKKSINEHTKKLFLDDFLSRYLEVIYEYITQQNQHYSSSGGMIMIACITEFWRPVDGISNKFDTLFVNLVSLCNAFILPPENVHEMLMRTLSGKVSNNLISKFIGLRVDKKAVKWF